VAQTSVCAIGKKQGLFQQPLKPVPPFNLPSCHDRGMARRITILIGIVALLFLGIIFYQSWEASRGLQVDPNASKEIEKAKQR